jgi:hypothetical protein
LALPIDHISKVGDESEILATKWILRRFCKNNSIRIEGSINEERETKTKTKRERETKRKRERNQHTQKSKERMRWGK